MHISFCKVEMKGAVYHLFFLRKKKKNRWLLNATFIYTFENFHNVAATFIGVADVAWISCPRPRTMTDATTWLFAIHTWRTHNPTPHTYHVSSSSLSCVLVFIVFLVLHTNTHHTHVLSNSNSTRFPNALSFLQNYLEMLLSIN